MPCPGSEASVHLCTGTRKRKQELAVCPKQIKENTRLSAAAISGAGAVQLRWSLPTSNVLMHNQRDGCYRVSALGVVGFGDTTQPWTEKSVRWLRNYWTKITEIDRYVFGPKKWSTDQNAAGLDYHIPNSI